MAGFEIDLIVWKLSIPSPSTVFSVVFEIDLIVWKWKTFRK